MEHRYETLRSWCIVGRCRSRQLFEGLYGVLVIWLLWGIISLFIYVGNQIGAYFRRETVAALITTAIIVGLSFGWFTTFVSGRAEAVNAQHRADSVAYEYSKLTQMFDSTDIVVINGDTIDIDR